MSTSQSIAAVIVAAGQSRRAGEGLPKPYRDLGGKPVLTRTLAAFAARPEIGLIVVVIAPDHRALFDSAVAGLSPAPRAVEGGASRTQSVRRGLEALNDAPPDYVLIHDAARPFVSPALIDRVEAGLLVSDGVVPALPVADALKSVGASGDLGADVPRAEVRAVQTPQGFRYAPLLAAFEALAPDADFSDDAAVAVEAGMTVRAVEGDPANVKLTYPEDFKRLSAAASAGRIAVGNGFDAHRVGPGDGVTLCGVRIKADFSLVGHSDADVGLHALTDAVLGAAGAEDIGAHFSPKDDRWRGADSRQFLAEAVRLLESRGGAPTHADVTLICERPKIAPHRDEMRRVAAELLRLDPTRVSVKATTTERMGFTGRGEGVAALATVTAQFD